MTEHTSEPTRRQPLGDQFRSTDFETAEQIRRAVASEQPTQVTDSIRRDLLKRHIASAVTTRPVAVRPPQIHHQHSFDVAVGATVIRYCNRCGMAWVLVQRSRYWSSGWRWEEIHEQ